jgi:galactokinase
MVNIISGDSHNLKDVQNFLNLIDKLEENTIPEARSLFKSNTETYITRAPGRLDVMGGIAEYSGSLVLQLPLREATVAALQLSPDKNIRIVSLSTEDPQRSAYFEMELDNFIHNNDAIDYKSAQNFFQEDSATQWAAYVAGAFLVLRKMKGIQFSQGVNILIHSDVPEGKGVSSSAAIEVATMQAITKAYDINISSRELAILCQMVENLVVGAPCGVMDQMTASCGKGNQLLALLCQPVELKSPVKIPPEISFWGIDSGISHSVSGSDYTSVRIGTFMGYKIISELAKQNKIPNNIKKTVKNEYLANITPSIFEQYFAEKLPDEMKGSAFIEKYQNTADNVTVINPDFVYKIDKPTAHPIYEHFRVQLFAELLKKFLTELTLIQLGEFMYQSHASYSACGLGSDGTDRLVELTREVDHKKGLFGAKITGGGSGGTVVILGTKDAESSVKTIVDKYTSETGYQPYVFSGSSMGAADFDHIIIKI